MGSFGLQSLCRRNGSLGRHVCFALFDAQQASAIVKLLVATWKRLEFFVVVVLREKEECGEKRILGGFYGGKGAGV